jgi:dihydrofolate reductase
VTKIIAKQQQGEDITVGASGILVRFLLREGLLDELRLLVHPVAVRYTLGHGTVAPTFSEVSQCAS